MKPIRNSLHTHKRIKLFSFKVVIFFFLVFETYSFGQKIDRQIIEVPLVTPPKLDGVSSDACWQEISWNSLDQSWIGGTYSPEDFSGKYKIVWDEQALYVLVEIQDDTLLDQQSDPLKLWWDDDCVEVFIDADNSGGGHQYSHNAFAYHVSLEGDVVDLGPDYHPHLYNDHVQSARKTIGTTSIWELKVSVVGDDYEDGDKVNALQLKEGLHIGFALAYCDNDNSKEREHFIGSIPIDGLDKNRGWIDADVFGTLLLKGN